MNASLSSKRGTAGAVLRHDTSPNRSDTAFSLLELIVAAAILSILTLILASMTNSLTGLWQEGIAHNERRSIARTVFSRMSHDLSIAARPNDFGVYSSTPATDPNRSRLVINPNSVAAGYKLPQAVFWEAPVASDRSKGDCAWIGYFVQWVSESGVTRPKLSRLQVDPSVSEYLNPKPAPWITDPLLAAFAPTTRASGYRGQLAENVLGLWVQPLDASGNPVSMLADGTAPAAGQFDTAQGYRVTLPGSSGSGITHTYSAALPASIRLGIVTVDSRTARSLTGSEKPSGITNDPQQDMERFVQSLDPKLRRGTEIHSTKVELFNSPH